MVQKKAIGSAIPAFKVLMELTFFNKFELSLLIFFPTGICAIIKFGVSVSRNEINIL